MLDSRAKSVYSLLSGGADSSLAIWDLEAADLDEEYGLSHKPLSYAAK